MSPPVRLRRLTAVEARARLGGWVRVGVIPQFALSTDGRPEATTVFYKALAQ